MCGYVGVKVCECVSVDGGCLVWVSGCVGVWVCVCVCGCEGVRVCWCVGVWVCGECVNV